jgi:hypothetical protein
MDTLNEIISLLRVVIIPLGVIFRVIFCLTKMIYDEEAQGSYKRKIRNTIVFGIIAELIFVILDLVQNYYGTGSILPTYFSGGGQGGGGGGSW